MANSTVGNILRKLRDNAGLSAKDVANLLKHRYSIDMEHVTLYNYEKGRSSPDIDRFLALCKIYGCTDVLYTFGYSDTPSTPSLLQPEEEQILKKYHALPSSGQNMILGALGIDKTKQNNQKIS